MILTLTGSACVAFTAYSVDQIGGVTVQHMQIALDPVSRYCGTPVGGLSEALLAMKYDAIAALSLLLLQLC